MLDVLIQSVLFFYYLKEPRLVVHELDHYQHDLQDVLEYCRQDGELANKQVLPDKTLATYNIYYIKLLKPILLFFKYLKNKVPTPTI